MISNRRLAIIFSILAVLLSEGLAAPGTATFYPNAESSECYGNGVKVVGNTAAASNILWANATACGKMFKVTCTGPTKRTPNPCTGKSVVVKIIDYCPNCGGTLVLAKDAFTAISTLDAGIINVDYTPA